MENRIFSGEELLQNMKVLQHNIQPKFYCQGVKINSKEVKDGNIFFALRGKKVDSHDFIPEALQNGAQVCIVDHLTEDLQGERFKYILVEDVLESLFRLAEYCRAEIKGQVIAVTGSAGKTTTKNWLTEILGTAGKTCSTWKNKNTDIGAALTLTNCPSDVDFCVVEVGMSTPGEISKTSRLIKPDIALITNIKPVHIGNFNSLEEIVYEKTCIVDGMSPNGTIFLNRDEMPFQTALDFIAQKKNLNVSTFGRGEECDCFLKSVKSLDQKFSVEARIFGKEVQVELQNIGEQFIPNILGILGIVKVLNFNLEKITPHLKNLHLYSGSGLVKDVLTQKGKIKVIDESYSANPNSVVCAIRRLAALDGKRKIAILGEMYELGDYLEEGLKKIRECLIENKIDLVFTSGPGIKSLFENLPDEMRGGHCDEVDGGMLDGIMEEGDIFLVKGSHGSNAENGRMYEFVKRLFSYSVSDF